MRNDKYTLSKLDSVLDTIQLLNLNKLSVSKNNKIFQSIKDNPQLMNRYGYKDPYIINSHIRIFESVKTKVDVTSIIENDYSIFPFIYAEVRTNYINGVITEVE